MNLGTKLNQLRKSSGMSLKELSSKTLISSSFLSDIETGKSNPSYEKLNALARALNVTPSYFIDDVMVSANVPIDSLLSDPDFLPIVNLLSDFRDWKETDKRELLDYLRAKKCIREYR